MKLTKRIIVFIFAFVNLVMCNVEVTVNESKFPEIKVDGIVLPIQNSEWRVIQRPQPYLKPRQGWKINIPSNKDNAKAVLELVLNILIEKKYNFQFRVDSKDNEKPILIQIYPKNAKHMAEIFNVLEPELLKLAETTPAQNTINGDLKVGTSGYFYIRYGLLENYGKEVAKNLLFPVKAHNYAPLDMWEHQDVSECKVQSENILFYYYDDQDSPKCLIYPKYEVKQFDKDTYFENKDFPFINKSFVQDKTSLQNPFPKDTILHFRSKKIKWEAFLKKLKNTKDLSKWDQPNKFKNKGKKF